MPNKLFERNIEDITIGVSDIYLYYPEELDNAQVGYRIDVEGNNINKWLGDNYVIIGNDSCCWDPIITDVSNENLPVYSLFCDDWDSLVKIANDFSSYIEILNKINETNLNKEEEKIG